MFSPKEKKSVRKSVFFALKPQITEYYGPKNQYYDFPIKRPKNTNSFRLLINFNIITTIRLCHKSYLI